jgi:hypothetical protein
MLDQAARWYASAAALRTRILEEGVCEVLERGSEDRARSYWTTFPHLILWTDLEREMLEELARDATWSQAGLAARTGRGASSSELAAMLFFCLRVYRLHEWEGRRSIAEPMRSTVARILDRLVAMDRNRDGFPDLALEEERQAAGAGLPFLHLAALQQATRFGRGGEQASWMHPGWERCWVRARESLAAGRPAGLRWSGRGYTLEGVPGAPCDQAQCYAWLFGLTGWEARIDSQIAFLDEGMSPAGIPARRFTSQTASGKTVEPVQPQLNFADAQGRLQTGRLASGLSLLRRVALADLREDGDFLPSQFLDPQRIIPLGIELYGPNAAYLGAFLHGVLGVRRDGDLVEITPCAGLGLERALLPIVLPEGAITLERHAVGDELSLSVASRIANPMRVRYRLLLEEGERAPVWIEDRAAIAEELRAVDSLVPTERSGGRSYALIELHCETDQPSSCRLRRRR